MEKSGEFNFNNHFCDRTKKLALSICKMVDCLIFTESTRIIGKQLLRSSTSVAANFRAASRGRSPAEYYSKICIVVEECDETLFWLEMLKDLNKMENKDLLFISKEALELLKVFSTTKKKLKSNKP
jgi:four helix bundle protein